MEDDIKLSQSERLLSGLPAKGLTTGIGLYGLAKAARTQASKTIIGGGGLRMSNMPKGFYIPGANQMKVMVHNLAYRQSEDIIELITKAQEAYKNPTGYYHNAYTDALDAMMKIMKTSAEAELKNIPLKRFTEIKRIIYYNYMDCRVIIDILKMLGKMI